VNTIAIIACRNEEAYLGNCLTHLVENGVKFAIIDNDSQDRTSEILALPQFRSSLVHYERFPFDGFYPWRKLLDRKAAVAETIGADWVIHLDADEIMHSYRDHETLAKAIERIAATGADVIDMDEFVFIPVDHPYIVDCSGPQPMRHYYFFAPSRNHLMRACKTGLGMSWTKGGGHTVERPGGASFKLANETLAKRHYIFLDQMHAYTKFAERRYDPRELEIGWHANRYNQPRARFTFPDPGQLKSLDVAASRTFDKSNPKLLHYWQW
jgi:glycosyltransferase involved in cell wall biosynthesis